MVLCSLKACHWVKYDCEQVKAVGSWHSHPDSLRLFCGERLRQKKQESLGLMFSLMMDPVWFGSLFPFSLSLFFRLCVCVCVCTPPKYFACKLPAHTWHVCVGVRQAAQGQFELWLIIILRDDYYYCWWKLIARGAPCQMAVSIVAGLAPAMLQCFGNLILLPYCSHNIILSLCCVCSVKIKSRMAQWKPCF